MEPISKENKYARINTDNSNLVCLSKSWYINLSYYFTLRAPEGIQVVVPTGELKKLRIQSTKPILIVFFVFALFSIGVGILYWKMPSGNETIEGNASSFITGIIVATIFLATAFFYNRSKFGQLKLLTTMYSGGWAVLYASTDREEIRSLKQTIESNMSTRKSPPRLVPVPPR